ncbi:hypothetical protein VB715_12620 [Crocosphaera sp. UHCC 0190]|uniref:hypothetical protein n=1 Tax=Crocosphaera sp. UHCC 0190 TaxID=3110246 RepID=UPI002B2172B0|nr:hypothetical protein [Crocosphaera sp. UHCC 0190]MEA5510609.1 hypothetical protein [Crocosphaera sp. UHCC 0190]
MKKLYLATLIAVAFTVPTISVCLSNIPPAIAGCGWGDITCNPDDWTCPPGGCPPTPRPNPRAQQTGQPISISSTNYVVFIGTVRNNTGYLTRIAGDTIASVGNAKWDTCPQNTQLLGHDFQQNGFWICASPQIAQGTWYFGNVVKDKGYYWEISGGKAKAAGNVKWDTCWSGSLLARNFHSNGYWVCSP